MQAALHADLPESKENQEGKAGIRLCQGGRQHNMLGTAQIGQHSAKDMATCIALAYDCREISVSKV